MYLKQGTRNRLDRYFFALMALVFVATATLGFGPNSVAIVLGEKPNTPLIVQIHAAAMVSWLGLLATQASLIALNKLFWHRQVGIAVVVLAPTIVVIMIVLAISSFPGLAFHRGDAIAVLQVKRIALFSLFCFMAYQLRNSDRESHKRFMIIATFTVLDAAFNRMTFLPTLGFESRFAFNRVAELALLVPLIVYDFAKLGRVHRATVLGVCLILPFTVAAILLW